MRAAPLADFYHHLAHRFTLAERIDRFAATRQWEGLRDQWLELAFGVPGEQLLEVVGVVLRLALGEWEKGDRFIFGCQRGGSVNKSVPFFLVTFDPKSGRVVLWDSKYRGPGGSYPSSIPESKLKSWTAEARAAVVQMPEGAMKNRILESLDKGKVDAKIFRWPQ